MKAPKTYTRDEVVALLQRSIALGEAAKDRPFTTADLLAAAKELELDPEVLKTAQAELERRSAARNVAPRPFDTRVGLEVSEGRFHLRIPPLRPSVKTLAPFGFVVVWITFLTFWTTQASKGSMAFALFSIPFWIAGAAMLRAFLFPLFQTTTMELAPDEGSLEIRPFGRRRRLRTRELRARLGLKGPRRTRSENDENAQEPALLLEHGTKTFPLLAGYSEQERRWVLAELEGWLHERGSAPP